MKKYIIKESQFRLISEVEDGLLGIAKRHILNKLDNMEFMHLKTEPKDFSYSEKGSDDPKYGIEAEWSKKGYYVIVGYALFHEIKSLFNLEEEQVYNLFKEILKEKGFQPIRSVETFDTSFMNQFL